ncbi:hypothetical protein E2C01_038860 [Portunus trituberculatus]|uniref:Uncharacterized protein n=1 Tax=Portunus trituberculatus TaxID=210409 RepID=A0A5B7FC18_PORTR|nr:hypothetical protein [Portunus trituberculatus]
MNSCHGRRCREPLRPPQDALSAILRLIARRNHAAAVGASRAGVRRASLMECKLVGERS